MSAVRIHIREIPDDEVVITWPPKKWGRRSAYVSIVLLESRIRT